MGDATRGSSRGGRGRRRAAHARLARGGRHALAGSILGALILAGSILGALILAGCAGTAGAGGPDACPAPTTGRIPRDDHDLLVLVDPAPSFAGEAPGVRRAVLDGLDAWEACDGRAGGTLRLAFTTTGRPDGAPVAAAGSPAILDTTRLPWADVRRLAAADLDAALAGRSGNEGIRTLTRAVATSGILRPGVPLRAAVATDRDDASPGDPAADARALAAEAPSLHLSLLASVDAGGAPARCTDAACNAGCTAPDPTAAPCYCGGAAASRRWVAFAAALPGAQVGSVCVPAAPPDCVSPVPGRIVLAAPAPGGDPGRLVLTVTHPGAAPHDCASPRPGETCAGGADWTYDPGPPAALVPCDAPGSACTLTPGSTFRVAGRGCP